MATPSAQTTRVINFEEFWRWLRQHPTCILSVSTPSSAVFDHDDLHWEFMENEEGRGISVLKGKAPIAELFVHQASVQKVSIEPDTEQEGAWVFECLGEGGPDDVLYVFQMAHGMDNAAHREFRH